MSYEMPRSKIICCALTAIYLRLATLYLTPL